MNDLLPRIYAVGAIRVSTEKQGRDGDSPDDQHKVIDRFSLSRNMTIQKYFAFLESGSKAEQPMQEAIDYCKDPKNQIKYFVIKSIDRFTRGGSRIYEDLKE
jgi:DNA invertase Pin-like site-specific DNA recombinase